MKIRFLSLVILTTSLVACATTPPPPAERAISVKLQGSSVEVQNFIEQRVRENGGEIDIESVTERELVFKANCLNVPNMNSIKCALVMMSVGNTGWSGPFMYITFRTAEIRGQTTLAANGRWCAINAFAKTNCLPAGSNAENNDMLRKIKADYEKEVRPLTDQ